MNHNPKNGDSRRSFLASSLSVSAALPAAFGFGGAIALSGGVADAQGDTKKASSDASSLTIAGYPYERVRAFENGGVQIPGYQVEFELGKIGELNQHVFNGPGTRDITEVGLIPFLLAFCNGGFRDYQLLPIFVLKVFRHKSIFIHADRGIEKPADLRGRKVATVGYSSSGLTWVRGILQDEYGVSPSEIQWVQTSKDSASGQTGGASAWEKVRPAGISIVDAPNGMDESDLLLSGEVDAIFHPAEPRAFVERNPKVRRLFSYPAAVERAYFKKTGIFPIMHLVAIRSDLVKEKPDLPKAIFDAYVQAKQRDYLEMRRIRWAYSSLPWFGQAHDETVAVMGENFYTYGIPENRKALETVFRYLDEQGLAERRLTVEELFVPSTLELKDAAG